MLVERILSLARQLTILSSARFVSCQNRVSRLRL